jgi:hypothetical protein
MDSLEPVTRVRLMGIGASLCAVLLAGCSGDDGRQGAGGAGPAQVSGGGVAGSATLRIDDLIKRAAPAMGGPKAGACPLPYDIGAAAKAAGLGGSTGPADGARIDAETSDSAAPGEFLTRVAPAAVIECSYEIGSIGVKTHLLATGKANSAVGGALPQVAFLSGTTDLVAFVQRAQAAKPGAAVAVPNGKAALVRLNVEGGDGTLVVWLDPAGGTSASQLTTLTEALGRQLH